MTQPRFTCQQIRHLVQARGLLIGVGVDVEALTYFRDEYLRRVGKRTYVSQMLDNAHRCAMQMCILTWPDGREVVGASLARSVNGRRCYEWIVENCAADDLPYMVSARLCEEHRAVRYL